MEETSKNQKKILFVDDEVPILKALTRLFFDSDYEIYTAKDGFEALEFLKQIKIDLVISDMRMPEMDGYELLSKVKELYPKVMRIMLSGYAEENMIFKALHKNIAKLYIFKPWENQYLVNLIDQVLQTEDLLEQKGLLQMINNIDHLPTINSNYLRIIKKIEEDEDIASISNEIENDLAIATKILQIANSAYFCSKAGSVQQAITMIGLVDTQNLIRATSVIDAMNVGHQMAKQIQSLWHHAYLCNKLLAFVYDKHLGKKLPNEAKYAGLLHNVGMVFFLKFYQEQYLELMKTALNKSQSMLDVEKEMFDVRHTEVGGYLLKWWEFSYPIIEAAMYHHDPMNKYVINQEIVCAVHIVDVYSSILLDSSFQKELDERAFYFLDLDKSVFEKSLINFSL